MHAYLFSCDCQGGMRKGEWTKEGGDGDEEQRMEREGQKEDNRDERVVEEIQDGKVGTLGANGGKEGGKNI